MIHDDYAARAIDSDINMTVPWWLMASYAYEKLNDPILTDAMFDEVAQLIDRNWDKITHRHKALLYRPLIKSSLAVRGKWPSMSKGAAFRLTQESPQ